MKITKCCVHLFIFFVLSCATNADEAFKVDLKNKLQSVLYVSNCLDINDEVGYEKIPVNGELTKNYYVDPQFPNVTNAFCSFHAINSRSQRFKVAGPGTICPKPGSVCEWQVKEDGFYFLTETGLKKEYDWKN